MEKRIYIGVAGSDQEQKEVRILPKTKAEDILKQLKLQGFALAHPNGGMFANSADVYDDVADGQKIYATKTEVTAGA